jgi:cytochrome P450
MRAKDADGKPLSDKQLEDTVIQFITAGRDTTAQVGGLWLADSVLQSLHQLLLFEKPRHQK